MTSLTKTDNKALSFWEDENKIKDIKNLFASNLTDLEFEFFCGIGKSTGLNPFLREIWAVKYDKSRPAQIFIGRDGYRKAAQLHWDYDYHQSDAVYSNDKFEVINGDIKHSYTLNDRGNLVGAYCIVKRRKSSRPIYVFVDKNEYSTGRSLWNEKDGKPATMIKKVAESQALRTAFQDLLAGTYGEEECQNSFESKSENIIVINKSGTECLKEILKNRNEGDKNENIIEINSEYQNTKTAQETIKSNNNESMDEFGTQEREISEQIVNNEQLESIHNLLIEKNIKDERLQKALKYLNVINFGQLTESQAELFITQLRKI